MFLQLYIGNPVLDKYFPTKHTKPQRGVFPGAYHHQQQYQYPPQRVVYRMPLQQQQQQQQPVLQAPEVQVTKTIENKAALQKKNIQIAKSKSGEGYKIQISLDATTGGRAKLYTSVKETLTAGKPIKFRPDSGERTNKPQMTPFEKGTDVAVRFRVAKMRNSEYNEKTKVYPMVIALWHEGEGEREDNEQAQITYFDVKNGEAIPIKQTLFTNNELYKLDDIYGMEEEEALTGVAVDGVADDDEANVCVICITDEKDTTIMPCRHMCLCSACANDLRKNTNKCPICRTEIESLLQFKKSDAPSPTS